MIGSAAEDLRGVLRPSAPQPRTVSARSSESELAFQEGHHFWDLYNTLHKPEDFDRAHAALERALKLDPANADAAAELGLLYDVKFEGGGAPIAEMLPEIQRWTDAALRIDSRNGLAHAALAHIEILKPVPDRLAMLHNGLKGLDHGHARRARRGAAEWRAAGISGPAHRGSPRAPRPVD